MKRHPGFTWTLVLIMGFLWHHLVNGPDNDPVTFEP